MNLQLFGVTNFDRIELKDEASITTDDAVEAADEAPTKEEFDAVVLLVNELKAKINSICKG